MKRKGARGSTSRSTSGRTSSADFYRKPAGSKISHTSVDGTHVPEKPYSENASRTKVSPAESRYANDGFLQQNRVDESYWSTSYGFNHQFDLGSEQGSIPRDWIGNFHGMGNPQRCGYCGGFPSSFPNSGPTQGYSAQQLVSFPTCCLSHQQELESLRSLNHTYHHQGKVNEGIAQRDIQPKQVSDVDCQGSGSYLHKKEYQYAAVELRSEHALLPAGGWTSLPASTRSSFDYDGDLGYISDLYSWSMSSDRYKNSNLSYSEKPNFLAFADEGSGRDRFLANPCR